MKICLAFTCAALAAVSAVTGPALAQHEHATATQTAAAEMADGEVRRVDAAKGTILLKHGEIKSIGMGAMTMGFKLQDAALATDLKVGDRIRFAVERQGEDLVVTGIQKVD